MKPSKYLRCYWCFEQFWGYISLLLNALPIYNLSTKQEPSFHIYFRHVDTPRLRLACFFMRILELCWSSLLKPCILTLVCLRFYTIWFDGFQMIDNFSGRIQLTLQPLLHSWENQPPTTRVLKTGISPQPWKITHTNYTFMSSVNYLASLLIQNRNFSMQLTEFWYLKSRGTIY